MPQSTMTPAPSTPQVSPQSILDAPVNLFHGVLDTAPVKGFTIADALELIRSGMYRQEVQRLQTLRETEGEARYKAEKAQLDAVTFCGTFSPTRLKVSLTQHSGIVHGDLDDLLDVQAVKAQLCADRHTVYCFTSPSGSGLKVGLSVAIVDDDATYKLAWQAAADYHHNQYGIWWDTSGKDVSRLCFLSDDPDLYVNPDAVRFVVPAMAPASAPPPQYRPVLPTLTLDDSTLLDKARQAKSGAKFTRLWSGDATGYPSKSEADFALCCMLVWWTRHDPARVDRLFRQSVLSENIDRHKNPEDYLERTISNAMATETGNYDPTAHLGVSGNGTAAPQQTSSTPAAAADPSLGWNDYVNARYLVRTHGQDIRYCWPWHTWFVWTGTHWQRDESGAVRQKAKQTIKELARHAADLDDVQAKALMAHVKKSLGTAAIKAMIESAQDEPGMPLRWQDLDTDGWLLNCANGTLNLQTGKLQPHARADLLTRCLTVAYDPDALCPLWDAFLDRIMAGTQSLIRFLQRAVGYALTGVIREHVLLILWGKGRNGKSTFLNALLTLLGAYGLKAPSELLMVSQYDRHPTEKTLLHGKRFVAAIETEQGRKLAEAFVKEATGGDPITARRMREDPWTFEPTHKLFLATNHKPVIQGTDEAIWERPLLVPFTVTIPKAERDTRLSDKLQAELPGILAWAVQGCLAWQQTGLGEPKEVQEATASYRTEMDVVGQFIVECCLVDPRCSTKANELYEAYKRWRGDDAEDQRTWGMALTERGFERYTNNGTRYRGIGILESVKDLRNQRNHTEPLSQVDSSEIASRRETRKNGSVGSVGSVGLPLVENTPADTSSVPDEGDV